MEHVRQTELIQLVAGELATPRRAAVERHLADCAVCRALYEEQQAVWQALQPWQAQGAAPDLLAGIEAKLDTPAVVLRSPWSTAGRLARVAAAIVIGVGVGYGAARQGSGTHPIVAPVAAEDVEQAAAEALGIEYFEDLPTGLFGALDDLSDEAATEEGQS